MKMQNKRCSLCTRPLTPTTATTGQLRGANRSLFCRKCKASRDRRIDRRKAAGRTFTKRAGRRPSDNLPLYGAILSWKPQGYDSVVAVIRRNAAVAHGRTVKFVGVGSRTAEDMRNTFLSNFRAARLAGRVGTSTVAQDIPTNW